MRISKSKRIKIFGIGFISFLLLLILTLHSTFIEVDFDLLESKKHLKNSCPSLLIGPEFLKNNSLGLTLNDYKFETVQEFKDRLVKDKEFRYRSIELLSRFSVLKYNSSKNTFLTCGSSDYLHSFDRQVFINVCYALKHKYSFIHDKADSDLAGMANNYHKLIAIERTFGFNCKSALSFERVIWVDMDTIIVRFDEDLFSAFSKSRADFMLADHSISLNNGVILLRKSKWLIEFMKDWWGISSTFKDFYYTDNGSLFSAMLKYWYKSGLIKGNPKNFCDQDGVRTDPKKLRPCIINQLKHNGYDYNNRYNLGKIGLLPQVDFRFNHWYFPGKNDDNIPQPLIIKEEERDYYRFMAVGEHIYDWDKNDYYKLGDIIVHTKNPRRFTTDDVLKLAVDQVGDDFWQEFLTHLTSLS